MTARRIFKPELKAQVALDELAGLRSTAENFRAHQLKPQVISS